MESKIRKIGYARVSTADQRLDMQIAALRDYGIPDHLIFTDKVSGSERKRPGLTKALKYAQHNGTEFVVWKLDRLGRTVVGIIETMQIFEERGVRLVSLTEGFDLSTPFGKAIFHIMAAMAQMERDLIRERTIEGLRRARERGEVAGRRNAMTEERADRAAEMLAEGLTAKDILPEMQAMDGPPISRSRVFQWIKDYRTVAPDDPTDDR